MTAVLGLAFDSIAQLGLLLAGIMVAVASVVGNVCIALFGGLIDLGGRLIAPGFLAVRAGLKLAFVQFALLGALFFGAIAWGYLHRERILDAFVAVDARAASPAIYDAGNQFAGIFPAHRNLDDAGQDFAGYISVHGDQQPAYLWACLKHLEDRRFGTWLVSTLGFDPISTGRTLLALSVGRGGGHSNLPNQVSRSMRGTFPGSTEAPGQKLERKLTEWSDSPALIDLLSRDEVDAAQFVLSNLALINGASGSHAGSLPYGAEAASLILFRKPAATLSVAEQFLLAAANWRPIRVSPSDNPKGMQDVDRRWGLLKQRARNCLPLIGPVGTAEYRSAEGGIKSLSPPRLSDPALASMDDPSGGFSTSVNPVRRLRVLLGDGGLHQIKHDLDGIAGGPWRGHVTHADLAFSATRNFLFGKKVDATLGVLERRLGAGLQLRVTGPGNAVQRAQVIAVLADAETGNILRFYESGPVGAFDQARPVASLGKALVGAPVLARFDSPFSAYCNRAIVGIRNAGGAVGAKNCGTAAAYVLARDVYSRSLSLPLINRLAQISPKTIRRTALSLGFTLPSDVPPATAVPEGLFEATPRATLQAMIALSRAMSSLPGDVPAPRILSSVSSVAADGSVAAELTVGRSLQWAAVRQAVWPASPYLRQMLAAPLSSGGTLAALRHFRPEENAAFLFNVGKTGTSVTPNKLTRDTMIAGAFQLKHRKRVYAYFVLVGTPQPTAPLGSVNASAFAPIARLLIEEALNTVR